MSELLEHWPPTQLKSAPGHLEIRCETLRSQLRSRQPLRIAELSGVKFTELASGQGRFTISFWNAALEYSWPELSPIPNLETQLNSGKDQQEGDPILPVYVQALILYYLHTSDGTPNAKEWISFADLPGGRIYAPAFEGYSGNEIVKCYGEDVTAFQNSCIHSGGSRMEIADASFLFTPLPRLPLLAVYWRGDEEFPSACKILFDRSATHYLPLDACAVIGSLLARKLISNH